MPSQRQPFHIQCRLSCNSPAAPPVVCLAVAAVLRQHGVALLHAILPLPQLQEAAGQIALAADAQVLGLLGGLPCAKAKAETSTRRWFKREQSSNSEA
jgi:hypothetical protein